MALQTFVLGAFELAGALEVGTCLGIGAHALNENRSRSLEALHDVLSGQVLRADRIWGGSGWILIRGGKLGKNRVPLPGPDARKSRIRNGQVPAAEGNGASSGGSAATATSHGPVSVPGRPAVHTPGGAAEKSITRTTKPHGGHTATNTQSSAASGQNISSAGARNTTKKASGSGNALSPFNLFPNHRPTRLPGPPKAFDPAIFP
ncbi:hypothetical protein F1559_005178 [Cyanidiococcus yangmingshanensis]|uniref:Uncharacterized protein n=1 Tax=Cyanidiococcus yangmingshanensis TaxID=2690220 RepID=A0A7J7IPZ4_9RHOD|nr:hypothetical protein F1559_005178 [Cyanidiococcus yangmingshanensis]